ncbi:DUF4326 domain-containing protein [Streptomyces ureilyticus]|uniref:DUF4326 domain-containing protein n=1 Tax=Streptomyces ureilyticus TaxID=1775131 RepID=A0ABX0DGE8_9ACTN|nr:DUF4326 domain-containing protein [Streptomyces ureilyticus]NGO40642.1 DUF4326 domain-containing protein [Streptomyces ureilyticus]
MRTCTRIQRRRDRGWRKPERCMIVDRTSDFGNPFTVAHLVDIGYKEPEARQTAVAEFRHWLRGGRAYWTSTEGDRRREKILARLPELRGMDLACPCPPGVQPCHGDVLLEWAALSPLALEVRSAVARARVDRQRVHVGEEPMYDADALAAVLTRDVNSDCLVDFDPGDGIPQRCDNRTWNHYLRRQRLHEEAVTVRLVEVFA